jgi:hypothetical protein
MFSRSGKSTINQYLVFNQGDKKRTIDHASTLRKNDQDNLDVEPDDLEVMMGDKPNNIAEEM